MISTTLGFIPLGASCHACVVDWQSLTPVGPRRGGIAGHCRGGGEATSTAVAGHRPSYARPSTNNLCMPIGPRRGGIAGPRTRGAGKGKHIRALRLLLDHRRHSLPLIHNCAPYLGAVLLLHSAIAFIPLTRTTKAMVTRMTAQLPPLLLTAYIGPLSPLSLTLPPRHLCPPHWHLRGGSAR